MPDESIINIILKLFDTLTETMKDTNNTVKTLQTSIGECSHKLDMFSLDEVKRGISEHTKEAANKADKTVTVITSTSGDLNKKLDDIYNKIKQMIVIVVTAVTLFSIAVFISDIYTRPTSNTHLQKTLTELTNALDDHNKTLDRREKQNEIQLDKIKELEKTIRELQKNLEEHEKKGFSPHD